MHAHMAVFLPSRNLPFFNGGMWLFFPPGWLRRRQADLITVQVPASLVMSRTIGVHFSARHLRASLLGITNVVRGGTAVFIMIALKKKNHPWDRANASLRAAKRSDARGRTALKHCTGVLQSARLPSLAARKRVGVHSGGLVQDCVHSGTKGPSANPSHPFAAYNAPA
jgi:hypothetical protein